MTSVERVTRALRGEGTDRAPVIPEIIQHALDISGVTHRAYSTDPRVLAQAQIAAQRLYGYDAVYISSDNYILAEALGGEVTFPGEDAPPQLRRHPIEDITDYAWPPFDVRAGRIPVIMEATRLCREHYGDRVFVKTCTDSAPFSLAACLCGPEDWMVALLDDEEAAKALLDRCVDVVSAMGRAAYEAGAHAIAFGDSAASLISREMYAAFALPFAEKAIAAIHRDTGLPVFYHICGNTAHIVDLMADTGADCLELDSMVDLGWAHEATGGQCALEGNVSTIQAFLNGKPEDVRREADALLERFGRGGGFILGSACEVPRYTPRENVMALTRAAVEYPYNEA